MIIMITAMDEIDVRFDYDYSYHNLPCFESNMRASHHCFVQ